MDFHSTVFLFAWLPLSLVVYYLVPGKVRNGVLLAESLAFYAWGAPRYLPLAVILTALGYGVGRALERISWAGRRKALLASAVALQIGLLLYYKYGAFLAGLLPRMFQGGLSFQEVLPLGLSYYSFKLISYEVDVYRGKHPAEKNPIAFGVYILMFPQLLVGPITRYEEMAASLHEQEQRCTWADLEAGARLFVCGMARKVLLADPLGRLWQTVGTGQGIESASSALVWLGVAAFSLELYLDFAGYSQMSIGLSRMLGFSCPANFDRPYQAISIRDFWRRWHISLSRWFRDYVYIPLGGSRRGPVRRFAATLAVWLATGIWHGTGWNFLIWGLYHFLLLTLERWLAGPPRTGGKSPLTTHRLLERGLRHLLVLVLVAVGWGIFAVDSSDILPLLSKLLIPHGGISAWYYLRCYGLLLVAGIADCAGGFQWLWRKLEGVPLARSVCYGALLILCIAFVIGGSSQTALYAAF